MKKIVQHFSPAIIIHLADYQPISLRHWTNLIQQELKVKPISSYPEFTAEFAAKVGDLLHYLGWHRFPFNSFRLRVKLKINYNLAFFGQKPHAVNTT